MTSFFAKTSPILLLLLLLVILFDISSCQRPTVLPTSQVPAPSVSNGLESYIVLTVEPPPNEDRNHFSLRILSKAVGGDKLASFALLYTYSYAATGFAATLTPDQVSALQKQPEVLGIIKSKAIHLDPPPK